MGIAIIIFGLFAIFFAGIIMIIIGRTMRRRNFHEKAAAIMIVIGFLMVVRTAVSILTLVISKFM